MRIRDLLAAESIELNGSAAGKQDVLNKMVDLMAKSGKIRDVETYRKGVFAKNKIWIFTIWANVSCTIKTMWGTICGLPLSCSAG